MLFQVEFSGRMTINEVSSFEGTEKNSYKLI